MDKKIKTLKDLVPQASEEVLRDLLESTGGSVAKVRKLLGHRSPTSSLKPSANTRQVTLARFMLNAPPPPTLKQGQTLHLYDPADVEKTLPCTLHLDVFPEDLATRLLTSLLEESHAWPPNTFHMFDRACESAHQSAFYSGEKDGHQTKHTYNGKVLTSSFMFSKDMDAARQIVEETVNREIERRGHIKYQSRNRWRSNAAVCNRYEGPRSSVGYHSDQLTHLGPACVIASVSLGVTREFRLRRRQYPAAAKYGVLESAVASVHVPHNSLIIMHAGCQEQYKHTLAPAARGVLAPHAVAGSVRINITYRDYREEFAMEKNPICECKNPMILRTIRGEDETDDYGYRYAWICGSSYQGQPSCKTIYFPSFE
ncbi:uncharacterized protein SAPINGB_P000380 [Magnusiomyces paraingens]|uniref:Fe2OG dioxygenase domain-containing protein n=1 Tax=Magnusiomyces paraingens TaxID=2606893 RepID=A0A5E8B0J3_9ASCO|nr:uncharacterized protein SAPINGB_P000380 [Saprochaete ingens]VVT44330.1 unnamed protein product [Saprochaete ingens]